MKNAEKGSGGYFQHCLIFYVTHFPHSLVFNREHREHFKNRPPNGSGKGKLCSLFRKKE